jgi:ABC-type Fe3+/spermidine/putrescine transport system ATPase subunit
MEKFKQFTPGVRTTAMVFQNYTLFPHLTVWENVAIDLTYSGLSSIEIKERALQALQSVEAKSWALRKASNYRAVNNSALLWPVP